MILNIMNTRPVSFLVALLTWQVLLTDKQVCEAIQKSSYVIKAKPVADTPSGVTHFRRFLSPSLSQTARCNRLAVLLKLMADRGLDTFQVSDVAVAKPQYHQDHFSKIDIETLRFLYMEAIDDYKKAGRVDDGLVELVTCLREKFKNIDAKAYAFLNDPKLKQMIDQYEQLLDQPLSWLVDETGQQKHPNLLRGELAPEVKSALAGWLAGDQERLDALFNEQKPPEPTTTTTVAPSSTSAPQRQQVVAVATAGAVQASARAAEQPIEQSAEQDQQEEEEEELNEDEAGYLDQMIATIVATYHSLPLEAKLPDRCETYGRVMAAGKDDLYRENFAVELTSELDKKLKTAQGSEKAYKPPKEVRDNFLITVGSFNPLLGAAEVWLDLVDCASEWADEDEQVRDYLNSPEKEWIVEQLISQTEADESQQQQEPQREQQQKHEQH